MPRLSVPTCRRLFHLSASRKNHLSQFHARYNLISLLNQKMMFFFKGFTIFCVILNLMEFKYLCYLFFKARVKLTAKRSHPILPKPSSFRNFPAYEPLGKPLGKFKRAVYRSATQLTITIVRHFGTCHCRMSIPISESVARCPFYRALGCSIPQFALSLDVPHIT